MWRELHEGALGHPRGRLSTRGKGINYNKSGEFLVEWEGTRLGRHSAKTRSEAVNNNLQMSRKMHNYIQSRNYSINKVLHIFCEYPPPLTVSLHNISRHHRAFLFRLYILKFVPLSPPNHLFHQHLFFIPFQNTSITNPLLDLRQQCLTVHNPGTFTSPLMQSLVQGRTGDPLYLLNDY